MIQPIYYFWHSRYGFDNIIVGLISFSSFENDQHSGFLIQDSLELFVQNHLRQFLLYLILWQVNFFSNKFHLGRKKEFTNRYVLDKINMHIFKNSIKYYIPGLLNRVQWFCTNFAQAWFDTTNPNVVQQFCLLSILWYICLRSVKKWNILSWILN